MQPVGTIGQIPNIHSDNVVQQMSKDSGSDSDTEAWSFDKAINEVFRLLPQVMYPKPSEEHTPVKPLSEIEQIMESHATPQSKLVENTTKFIQDRLVTSLAPMKYYISQKQYFPTDNASHLESDASQTRHV